MNKNIILVVDDIELNRDILCNSFEDKYEIKEASNGVEAIEIIEAYKDRLLAVLLDIVMPEMDGFEVMKEMNKRQLMKYIPVFLITSETDPSYLQKGFDLGAVDVITKPFAISFIKRRIENIIELYKHRYSLQQIVNQQIQRIQYQERELYDATRSIIDTLSTAIEFRDCESGDHVNRIRKITRALLNELVRNNEYQFTPRQIELIGDAAVMHDVGKIAISDQILNKPGRLTKEEFEIMKTYTIRGCELLENIEQLKKSDLYEYCYDICRHHHERYDGNGYPDGLKGDEISIWAQIVSIADVYDALISIRIYKPAFQYEEAMKMINDGECGVFNPLLLKYFNQVAYDIYQNYYQNIGTKNEKE